MDDETLARLTDLEMRAAHHERQAEEMSDVLARQHDEIDRLNLLVRRLLERLQAVEAGIERSPQDDRPPPHY
ncbi:SlyX family protein [Magnetospirillum moscoviense]|uniref:Protein SlyX homolog n=1 Tax=Magnetospirillum moscoviense TaxID=1437059 RepID=A0A178MM72_9PROT|nr:SlyX family protein [Magnetospirillum moscoviense]OAN49766.1 SlyX protein [Magnetospirillum moscoviense]